MFSDSSRDEANYLFSRTTNLPILLYTSLSDVFATDIRL